MGLSVRRADRGAVAAGWAGALNAMETHFQTVPLAIKWVLSVCSAPPHHSQGGGKGSFVEEKKKKGKEKKRRNSEFFPLYNQATETSLGTWT